MKIPNNIKNIIFDLGGVIMDLDIDKTRNALSLLGFDESMFHLHETDKDNIFILLERGLITENAFFSGLIQIIGSPLSVTRLKKAWNGMIADFQPKKIKLLQDLKPQYRTFLLSNTNTIHIQRCNEILKKKYHLSGLNELFEKTYYSYETGLRKPEPGFFRFVLEKSHLQPSETLFIDDSPEHIEAARHTGIITLLHKRNAPLDLEP